MDKFENVTVVKAANVYFDGKVTSRTVLFENGEKKTMMYPIRHYRYPFYTVLLQKTL